MQIGLKQHKTLEYSSNVFVCFDVPDAQTRENDIFGGDGILWRNQAFVFVGRRSIEGGVAKSTATTGKALFE